MYLGPYFKIVLLDSSTKLEFRCYESSSVNSWTLAQIQSVLYQAF
jgi:hypothetical protein